MTYATINETFALRLAEPDCADCLGSGWVMEGYYDDRHEKYCHCVMAKINAKKIEMQSEPEQ